MFFFTSLILFVAFLVPFFSFISSGFTVFLRLVDFSTNLDMACMTDKKNEYNHLIFLIPSKYLTSRGLMIINDICR